MRRGLGKGSDLEEDVESLVAELRAENELAAHNENWLVSYADMMTLLFGFFAMLYLMNGKIEPMAPPSTPPAVAATEAPPAPAPAAGAGATAAPRVHARDAGSSGGNSGDFLLDALPRELLVALGAAWILHYFFYRWGKRRRRLEIQSFRGERETLRPPPPLRVRGDQPAAAALEDAGPFGLEGEAAEEIDGFGESHWPVLADERWLISYADLMTLLFGFFAMLYLMGPNFDAVKKAMEDTFAKEPAKPPRETVSEKLAMPSNLSKEMLQEPMAAPPPLPIQPVAPPPPTVAQVEPPKEAVPPPTATVTKSETRRTPTLQEMEEQEMQALRERLAKTRIARRDGTSGSDGDVGGSGASKGGGGAGGSGMGGGGQGGGRGGRRGHGSQAGYGSTICDSTASNPYSPTCSGSGFFGCLDPDWIFSPGGLNGDGGTLEYYCLEGRTRVCLTWERCPWRNEAENPQDYPEGLQTAQAPPAAMSCSPYGLPPLSGRGALLATCRGDSRTCGFSKLYCDPAGRLTVAP